MEDGSAKQCFSQWFSIARKCAVKCTGEKNDLMDELCGAMCRLRRGGITCDNTMQEFIREGNRICVELPTSRRKLNQRERHPRSKVHLNPLELRVREENQR